MSSAQARAVRPGPSRSRPARRRAHTPAARAERDGRHPRRCPVRGRVRQRPDGVDHLDHGAGPAMGHDQRQRVLMRRLDVDEVDVDAIDLADELREPHPGAPRSARSRTRPASNARGLAASPAGHPAIGRRQLLARPTCRADAFAKFVELLLGNVDLEGADVGGRRVVALMVSPLGSVGARFAGSTPASSAASPRSVAPVDCPG